MVTRVGFKMRQIRQTPAELAGGAVIVNDEYDPGHAYRYGDNDTPGTTDMFDALQASLNQAENGGVAVYWPADRYLLSAGLTCTSSVSIFGDGIGRTILEPDGDFIALTVGDATVVASTTATAATAINVGDVEYGLTSVTGIEAGQILTLVSDAVWYHDAARFFKGELHILQSLDGLDARLWDSMYDSYETSEALTVKAYTATVANLQDFEIVYPSENAVTVGLVLQYVKDSTITRVKVGGNNIASMGCAGSIGVVFDKCIADGANHGTSGFGFSITSSNNVIVDKAHINNCHFGVDLGTVIPSRNNTMKNCIVVGGGFMIDGTTLNNTQAIGAECHGAAENCSFSGNKFINCYRGFLINGSNMSVVDNEFIGCIYEGVWVVDASNPSIRNNRSYDMTTGRAEVGSGVTATPFQRPERFITVEGAVLSGTLDIHDNIATARSRFLQFQGTDTHENVRITGNHVDLYGQTAGTSVLFFGAGALTVNSGVIKDNTWTVEQGNFVEVSPCVGVPTHGAFVGAANVIGRAETESSFFLNNVAGFTSTLPAPVLGERLKYTFYVSAAPTGGNYVIATDSGANLLFGNWLDVSGELTNFASQDIFNFVANKSKVGDKLVVECDGFQWHCEAFTGLDGGITTAVT